MSPGRPSPESRNNHHHWYRSVNQARSAEGEPLKSIGSPTRNLMFTGKGGVGKTSIACATAVFLAESGKRVLLVSTDPASNLDEVLETRLSMRPTLVEKVK